MDIISYVNSCLREELKQQNINKLSTFMNNYCRIQYYCSNRNYKITFGSSTYGFGQIELTGDYKEI